MKIVSTVFLSFTLCVSLYAPVFAQSTGATFAFSPSSKSVRINNTFTVNIVIKSTSGKKISYARAIAAFDPSALELVNAEAGSIFCNYPTDEANYESDNTAGRLMITGIATGASGCAYPEPTSSGIVFATLTFKAKKLGNADVTFVYNGRQADDQSGITDTNSPPQYFMTPPQDGSYTIVNTATPTPTPKVPPNLGVDPRITIAGALVLSIIAFVLSRKQYTPRVIATTEV